MITYLDDLALCKQFAGFKEKLVIMDLSQRDCLCLCSVYKNERADKLQNACVWDSVFMSKSNRDLIITHSSEIPWFGGILPFFPLSQSQKLINAFGQTFFMYLV